jgi:2-amino-4-hydroxy-6-hydroxymethyldihydropteridine diphosphokinase
MSIIYLGLGSNQGERLNNLRYATENIREQMGNIISSSSIYETGPWGYKSNNLFLNQVISIESSLEPEEILKGISAIEAKMGRLRAAGEYADRTIDIDLLLYDERVISTDVLTVPHPQMHQRKFVLKPLAEIAAGRMHPVFYKSFDQLLAECDDQGSIELYHV